MKRREKHKMMYLKTHISRKEHYIFFKDTCLSKDIYAKAAVSGRKVGRRVDLINEERQVIQ